MSDHVTLRSASASHPGLVRPNNEDSLFAGNRLIAVADGVGGQAAGEVASKLTIEAVAPVDTADFEDPVEALRSAVTLASQRIRDAAADEPARSGMATTLTALLLTGDTLVLAHAGDSRAYLLHEGEIAQITRDDTFVQALVDEGCITAEQAEVHPQKSLVTRVLQGSPVEATYLEMEPVPGDRYLLCSDGLTDAAAVSAIADALREESDLDSCAARLVELALAGGGPDNVTVIVADLVAGVSDE